MTGCPRERFPTLTHALEALAQRRARAALSGSPTALEAYVCERCRGAHLRRTLPYRCPLCDRRYRTRMTQCRGDVWTVGGTTHEAAQPVAVEVLATERAAA